VPLESQRRDLVTPVQGRYPGEARPRFGPVFVG